MIFNLCYTADLAPVYDTALPVNRYTEDEKSYGEIVTASSYLNRIQLFTGSSPAIAEGKISPGHFGYVKAKDSIEDLGTQIDCLPLSWRFKAMEFGGDAPLSVYNPKHVEFLRIQAKSDAANSGCSFGVEFLIWLPKLKVFSTYFFNSKTSRREAPNLKNLLDNKQAATIKANLIKRGSQMWHGPLVTICSTKPFDMPDVDEMIDQATKFANPKETEIEKVDEATTSSRPQ